VKQSVQRPAVLHPPYCMLSGENISVLSAFETRVVTGGAGPGAG
jgi:hypothetical protein